MPNYGYLAHHGIEGQKWGKRNGPPYPLDPEDHSAAEKKANHGVYSQGVKQDRSGDGSPDSARKSQEVPDPDILNDKKKEIDKKKLLIGAGIAAGVLAVVGTATVGGIYYANNKEAVDSALKNAGDKVVEKLSSSKLGSSIVNDINDIKNDKAEEKIADLQKKWIKSGNTEFIDRVKNDKKAYTSLLLNSKVMSDRGAAKVLTAMSMDPDNKEIYGVAKTLSDARKNLNKTANSFVEDAVATEAVSGISGKVQKYSNKLTDLTGKLSAPSKTINATTNKIRNDIGAISGTIGTGLGVYGYVKSKKNQKNNQNTQENQYGQNQQNNNYGQNQQHNNYDNRNPKNRKNNNRR